MSKKSFILHIDSLLILDELTDDQSGKLFKAIHNYQRDKSLPNDPIIKMAFIPFKNQFLRDDEKYSEFTNMQSEKGIKSAEARKLAKLTALNQDEPNLTTVNHGKPSPTESTYNVSDSVSDSANVNDSVNESKKEKVNNKEKKDFVPNGTFQTFINEYSLFFEKKNGVKPKIGSSDGKAANELIEYLKGVSIEKNEQGAIDSFKFILTQWDKLDNFYGSQIKLIQISANINNIINQIKNGTKGKSTDKNQHLRDAIRADFERNVANGHNHTTK